MTLTSAEGRRRREEEEEKKRGPKEPCSVPEALLYSWIDLTAVEMSDRPLEHTAPDLQDSLIQTYNKVETVEEADRCIGALIRRRDTWKRWVSIPNTAISPLHRCSSAAVD